MSKVTIQRSAPGKRGAKAITRARVAELAFELVDHEGADALSARKLARALGCEAMSLYHHVANMEMVLDDVVDRLLQQCSPPPINQEPIALQLERAAQQYLTLAIKHPRVFALAAGRRWVSPSAYALAGALLALFEAGGLPAREAGRSARTLAAFLNGAGMALSGWAMREGSSAAPLAQPSPDAARLQTAFAPERLHDDLDHGLRTVIHTLLHASN